MWPIGDSRRNWLQLTKLPQIKTQISHSHKRTVTHTYLSKYFYMYIGVCTSMYVCFVYDISNVARMSKLLRRQTH